MSRIDQRTGQRPATVIAAYPPTRCPTRCAAERCSSTSGRSRSAPAKARCRGALVIERNVLEWRCDPTSDARLPQAVGDDVEWVIVCSEGYTSSLAAAALLDLGLHRATDVVGGYHALAGAGVLAQLAAGRPASPVRSVNPPAAGSAAARWRYRSALYTPG